MKIKLGANHQVTFSDGVPLHHCLGVLQLASALRRRNKGNTHIEVLDFSEFHHLYTRDFNETMERVVEKILSPIPDVIGFSTMSNNLPVAIEICERIKQGHPGVITLLGGQGASFCASEIIEAFPFVDAVIRGEADKAFPDYIEALSSNLKNPGIKGLVHRDGDSVIDNGWPDPIQNLDDLPTPAYDLCGEYSGYDTPNDPVGDYNGISLEAGRGCSFNCVFCSTSHFFKRKHRLKSVGKVIDEILVTREKFGNQRVIFNHDILVYHHDYIDELCREIKLKVPGLTWKCHARFDTIDANILEKMRDAGCNEIFLGIETATPRMQKLINKQLDLDKFEDTLTTLRDLNYRFSLSFIVGFPEEEPADIEAIFALALQARQICGENAVLKIHTLVPLAGSDIYAKWKDRLEFDEYGSVGASDIPRSWSKPWEMIKRYPAIFPLYHHIPIGVSHRIRSSKFQLAGMAIDSFMKYSARLAYEALGNDLAASFVRFIDQIVLPPPAPFHEIDYSRSIQSIRELILKLLEKDPVQAAKYDSLAQFEIAMRLVSDQIVPGPGKFIETFYDPSELILEIKTGMRTTDNSPIDKKQHYLVHRDSKSNKIRCALVPPQFNGLLDIK